MSESSSFGIVPIRLRVANSSSAYQTVAPSSGSPGLSDDFISHDLLENLKKFTVVVCYLIDLRPNHCLTFFGSFRAFHN